MNYEQTNQYAQASDSQVSAVMKRVYLVMTLGLAITGVLSWFCGTSRGYLMFLAENHWMLWAFIIAQFAIVIGIGAGINKLSTPVATLLFLLYSVVMGLWMAPLFATYSPTVIAKTFFITAGTFGAMSIYGFCTNRDLSRIGSFLMMALFGLIICMLVNIFVQSSGFDWLISILGVLIFIGLTAWDTQQMKLIADQAPAHMAMRYAVLGALNLYLDFINLFLFLLRIFGGNRD